MKRSIKHEVERRVISKLALAHETEQLTNGCEVQISAVEIDKDDDAQLKISIKKPNQKSFVELLEALPTAEGSSFL